MRKEYATHIAFLSIQSYNSGVKVVLSSTNKAKTLAVQKIFQKFYEDIELITVVVDSEVSITPVNDDDGIQGALNRIENAKKTITDGDVYIGLEGIITTNSFGSFICGWSVVDFTNENKKGIGCSAKVKLADTIANNIKSFEELSEMVKKSYPSNLLDKMDEIGTNGVITLEIYSRTREFEDALECALSFASNENNYRN